MNSVGQTEPIPVHSTQKIEEIEYRISNNNPQDYFCYYCEYVTNNEGDYDRHVMLRHPGKLAYPNKAEIEKRGLEPQGKRWET